MSIKCQLSIYIFIGYKMYLCDKYISNAQIITSYKMKKFAKGCVHCLTVERNQFLIECNKQDEIGLIKELRRYTG